MKCAVSPCFQSAELIASALLPSGFRSGCVSCANGTSGSEFRPLAGASCARRSGCRSNTTDYRERTARRLLKLKASRACRQASGIVESVAGARPVAEIRRTIHRGRVSASASYPLWALAALSLTGFRGLHVDEEHVAVIDVHLHLLVARVHQPGETNEKRIRIFVPTRIYRRQAADTSSRSTSPGRLRRKSAHRFPWARDATGARQCRPAMRLC